MNLKDYFQDKLCPQCNHKITNIDTTYADEIGCEFRNDIQYHFCVSTTYIFRSFMHNNISYGLRFGYIIKNTISINDLYGAIILDVNDKIISTQYWVDIFLLEHNKFKNTIKNLIALT